MPPFRSTNYHCKDRANKESLLNTNRCEPLVNIDNLFLFQVFLLMKQMEHLKQTAY